MLMATGAGTAGREPRRRLPLADLTNLSSSASASHFTRPKAPAQSKSCASATSSSSIGSSTRPPPPAAEIKGKDKSTKELQRSSCQLKKISKPKVKTGFTLPGASSLPNKKTRKTTKEQQHREPLAHKFGGSLPTQNFIEKQRAYFAEIDALELVEEFVSGSDLE